MLRQESRKGDLVGIKFSCAKNLSGLFDLLADDFLEKIHIGAFLFLQQLHLAVFVEISFIAEFQHQVHIRKINRTGGWISGKVNTGHTSTATEGKTDIEVVHKGLYRSGIGCLSQGVVLNREHGRLRNLLFF